LIWEDSVDYAHMKKKNRELNESGTQTKGNEEGEEGEKGGQGVLIGPRKVVTHRNQLAPSSLNSSVFPRGDLGLTFDASPGKNHENRRTGPTLLLVSSPDWFSSIHIYTLGQQSIYCSVVRTALETTATTAPPRRRLCVQSHHAHPTES
jgi:hypothetical protein